jgi:S-methylmethionine-dependent homocysteine/selenocysteine methylase
MTKYRNHLPQLDGGIFLTDSGMETTLIFHEKIALPCFAAFDLLKDQRGIDLLHHYYARHATIARESGTGFILDSATWRANPDWAEKLGYSPRELDIANARAINMLFDLRAAYETATSPMVISGCVGPRGDGYDPGALMSPREAMVYHARQIGIFATSGVDLVTAYTLNNTNEAIGVTRAAREAGLPVAISFTLETDGRLPTGETLRDAIHFVDHATDDGPAYYMINCAHPTHFEQALDDGAWMTRLRGIRANASRRSHAELDEATELDDGDPVELGRQYRDLRARFPQINVLGGCCGTDHRHIEHICRSCGHTA